MNWQSRVQLYKDIYKVNSKVEALVQLVSQLEQELESLLTSMTTTNYSGLAEETLCYHQEGNPNQEYRT